MRFLQNSILVILLWWAAPVVAQEPLTTWGKPIPNENPNRELNRIFASDNTGYYALRERVVGFNRSQWLEKYGKDFTLEYSEEITLISGVVGDAYFYHGFYNVNDKFIMLGEHWEKGKSSNMLGWYAVGKDGVRSEEFQKLCKITATKMGNRGKFIADFSDDNSKMAVLREHPFEKGAGEKISITLYETASMTEIWNKDITLKTPSSKVQWHSVAVANDGSVYVYKKTHVKKVYTFALFSMDKQGGGWTKHDLTFGTKKIEDISLSFNSKQDFIASGFYYEEARGNLRPITGRFYFRIEGTTKKLAANSIIPFRADMMSDFVRAKATGINNFKLKEVLARSNGTILMIAEVDSRESTPIPGSMPMAYSYVHKSGSIGVFCVKEDGSQEWYVPIVKSQEISSKYSNKQWSSFIYHFKDDGLTFIWNDTHLSPAFIPPLKWKAPDGSEHVNKRDFSAQTRYPVFLAVIEPNGTSKFKNSSYGLPLFKMLAKGVFPMGLKSNVYYQEGNSLILVAEMRGESKRYKLGKLKL